LDAAGVRRMDVAVDSDDPTAPIVAISGFGTGS
jgi:hypothetical protein